MEEFGKKAGPGVSTVGQRDQYMTSMLGAVAQASPASTVNDLWQLVNPMVTVQCDQCDQVHVGTASDVTVCALQSASTGGPMKGSAFWLMFVPGQTSPVADGGEAGLFGIYPSDSTFDIISSNAKVSSIIA